MKNIIGTTAGEVWQHLNSNGPKTVAKLAEDLKISKPLLERAIGWLAREDKVQEIQKGKTSLFEARE